MSADFASSFAQLARDLRLSVHDLTDAERHLLKDIAETRYPMVTLRNVMRIARRSHRLEHRVALAELVRGECTPPVTGRDVAALGDDEIASQGNHDKSWPKFERLFARGIVCPSLARDVFITGSAHLAALSAQIAFVLPLIGQ